MASASKVKSKKTATEKSSKSKNTNTRQKKSSTGRNALPKKSSSARSASQKRKVVQVAPRREPVRIPGSLSDEIQIWIIIGLMVFLFLCNFHLCPGLGNYIYVFMHGIFGFMAYLLPIQIAVSCWFYIPNAENPNIRIKVMVAQILFLLLDTSIHLICVNSSELLSPVDYYKMGQVGVTGGVVGGLLSGLLQQIIGFSGTLLLLMIALIICVVLLTERSLIQPIQNFSEDLYTSAKEDIARRKQERQESHNLKEPVLHKGVMIGTKLKEHEMIELEPETDNGKSSEAEVAAAVIQQAIEPQKSDESVSAEPKSEEKTKETKESVIHPEDNEFKGTIYRDGRQDYVKKQQIYVEQDERTLEELRAFDSPDAASFSVQEVLSDDQEIQFIKEPEIQGIPIGELIETQVSVQQEQIPVDSDNINIHREEETPWKMLEPEIEEDGVLDWSQEFLEQEILEQEAEDKTQAKQDKEINTKQNKKKIEQKNEKSIWKQQGTNRQENSSGTTFTDIPKEVPKKQKKIIYQFPTLDLLHASEKEKDKDDTPLKETAIKLQQTLRNFGVGVTVTDICCGPTVTRYELHPEQGVKVSRILSLSDDIKLNLAAADIRIEAPIPGKAAVGIEVPNRENTVVSFRDLVESPGFTQSKSKVTFAIGKDISGKIIVSDIAKMPHLLIAGATGSGKSVCINTLVMSILYKATPDEVGLIMIDPKVVELSIYNGIPHLMTPIVTDPKKAANALNWAVCEMESRYSRFAEYNVRNLEGYNDKIRHVNESLPKDAEEEEKIPLMKRIVVIVDELADLMMVVSNEVEDAICRLSQKARAAGIHLVLATQRPSVDVITGLIKANIPSRIAFAVSSGVDARTILGENGAEKLLGKGDMLLKLTAMPKPVRVQGAFISDEEVENVVEVLKAQYAGHQNYHEDLEQKMEQEISLTGNASERDEYFERAGRFVIEKEKATIGMMQRAFKIGFNRASRIMDQLYEAGVVGEGEGTKPRKVLMTAEEFEDYIV